MSQVATVWTVSTNNIVSDVWDDHGIERLAGKGAVSRIWNKLKADHLTGFPKRPASDLEAGCAKRQKFEVSTSKQASPTTPSLLEGSVSGPAQCDTPTLSCPRNLDRKLAKAKRRDPAGVRGKITWWFDRQPATPDAPAISTLGTPSSKSNQPSPPTSLVQAKKQRDAKKRSRGRKQQRRQATTPTPLHAQEGSQNIDNDASPTLQPRLSPEASRKAKKSTQPTIPDVAKMTAGKVNKAARHSSTPEAKHAVGQETELDG